MQRYAAYGVAAIVIGGIVTGLQPAVATTYEPPLSIPNVTTVKAERGVPDKPPAEGYWERDMPQPGEQSSLSAFVMNNGDQPVKYVLVFQISYINNATQSIVWQEGELSPGNSQVISVLWTPDHPGGFKINIFGVTDLEKPAPLSKVISYHNFAGPQGPGEVRDILPDLTLLTTDQNGILRNQTGILGSFGYLIAADSTILIPKNSTKIDSGNLVRFEMSDSETWYLKETFIRYYGIRVDILPGREFDDYYDVGIYRESFNILESDDEKEYVVDLPAGDYVFGVYTTFQYKIGNMLVDDGYGDYYFRVLVD